VSGERLLIDTAFVQALLNRKDQYHAKARQFAPRLRAATEVWITETILVEIGNALGSYNRSAAASFIEQAYRTPNMHVVSVDSDLLQRALRLYRDRQDKTWGLTDCISFTVMAEQQVTDAVTADEHFRQAGYRALLLED
jgi:uncharacterized protein